MVYILADGTVSATPPPMSIPYKIAMAVAILGVIFGTIKVAFTPLEWANGKVSKERRTGGAKRRPYSA